MIEVGVKELNIIQGKSYNTAQRHMKLIRQYFDKKKHHVVTLCEIAEYYNISEKDLQRTLTEKIPHKTN